MTITRPKATTPNDDRNIDPIDQSILLDRIILYVKKQDIVNNRVQKDYSIIVGQCSEGVKSKIYGMSYLPTIYLSRSPIYLLKNINTVMFKFQYTKCHTP